MPVMIHFLDTGERPTTAKVTANCGQEIDFKPVVMMRKDWPVCDRCLEARRKLANSTRFTFPILTEEEHNVHLDYVGLNPRPRLTCYSCNGATLVCQPYMKSEWAQRQAEFMAIHPCSKVVNEGWRG